MPEATIREVDYQDVLKAQILVEIAGTLVSRVAPSNNMDVQGAANTLSVDLISYAKQLLKTPVPPEPEALAASPAE
ncbi:hypothetical protein FBY04_12021 [Pseudomonas sp. SJZ080]|uniref:hypothetical protein n=1 Tax=Pseudomonas sp. SJZ080 TaxID=2572888 RepID=UPI001199EE94|nr:hypothetical protein [Pseudomonas sp. SJZ080]TWC50128.1 hypothetical protein FBY04_12021 [Pseudomonas sp. SJZ080]